MKNRDDLRTRRSASHSRPEEFIKTSRQNQLAIREFRATKACCACGRGPMPKRFGFDHSVILVSISCLLYRSLGTKDHRKLRRGPNLYACDDCIAVFIASPSDRRTTAILTALRDGLCDVYNGLLEDMSE